MDTSQIALKLILSELDADSIQTFSGRKDAQKAIYLVQACGLDLGYRYGWYLRGPYCPDLTRDYYGLHSALESAEESEWRAKTLVPNAKAAIDSARALSEPPVEIGLDRSDWIELLASVHYWETFRNVSPSDAAKRIKQRKPSLAPFIDEARQALDQAGLEGNAAA